MKTSALTLEQFLANKNIKVKAWRFSPCDEKTLQIFLDNNKEYTLLPEYLAKNFDDSGVSVKHCVQATKHIAKIFNLDGEKFVNLVMQKLINMY